MATRDIWWTNGVRLVLLALSTTACAKAKSTDNANNASLTPPQRDPYYDQARLFLIRMDPKTFFRFFYFFDVDLIFISLYDTHTITYKKQIKTSSYLLH